MNEKRLILGAFVFVLNSMTFTVIVGVLLMHPGILNGPFVLKFLIFTWVMNLYFLYKAAQP